MHWSAREYLGGQFGYTAASPTAQLVLDGLYAFSPDINESTY